MRAAVEEVKQKYGAESSLYGIVNNAGVGFDHSMQRTLDVNTYGAKRVCEAFLPLLQKDGRIVNTASASGPNYVSRSSGEERQLLTDPEVTWEALDSFMKEAGAEPRGRQPYGLSKACLISYTMLMARLHPDLKVPASCAFASSSLNVPIPARLFRPSPPDQRHDTWLHPHGHHPGHGGHEAT